MSLRKITDWTVLPGASVEIRQQGIAICIGHVDTVTEDGKILWLQQTPALGRRLFEKAEFYEAWATEESCGFHYKVTTEAGLETPKTVEGPRD
jgi:hypothetical protein